MGTNEDREKVAQAATSFPARFGLRAFPGDRFKILIEHSFVSDGKVMLYTGRLMPDGKWASFAKGTVAELLREVVQAPVDADLETPADDSTHARLTHKQRDSILRIIIQRKDTLSGSIARSREMGATLHIPLAQDELDTLIGAEQVLHRTLDTSTKPKDLIDEAACKELRQLLLTRMSWIDEIWPHDETSSSGQERIDALGALFHLANELGFECEGFLYGVDDPFLARNQYPDLRPHAIALFNGSQRVEIISMPFIDKGRALVNARMEPGDPTTMETVPCIRLTPVKARPSAITISSTATHYVDWEHLFPVGGSRPVRLKLTFDGDKPELVDVVLLRGDAESFLTDEAKADVRQSFLDNLEMGHDFQAEAKPVLSWTSVGTDHP